MDYQQFSVTSAVDKTQYECQFRTLITGIAPRHSDTADVKFMVNGKPVVVALPLVAFSLFREHTGETLTDAEVIQIAAEILKESLEKEGLGEDRMVVPTGQRTVDLAGKIHSPVAG